MNEKQGYEVTYLDVDSDGKFKLDELNIDMLSASGHEIAHGSLRIILSEDTTMENIDYVVDELMLEKLRIQLIKLSWKP